MLRLGVYFVILGAVGILVRLTIPQLITRSIAIVNSGKTSTVISFPVAAQYDVRLGCDEKAVGEIRPEHTERANVDVTVTAEGPHIHEHFSAAPGFSRRMGGRVVISSSAHLLLHMRANTPYTITIYAPAEFARLNRCHPQLDFVPSYAESMNRALLRMALLAPGILSLFIGSIVLCASSVNCLYKKLRHSRPHSPPGGFSE